MVEIGTAGGYINVQQFAFAVPSVRLCGLSAYWGAELVLRGQQVSETVHRCRRLV